MNKELSKDLSQKRLEAAREKCRQYGQEHVFSYYEELSALEKENLIAQIEDLDFGVLSYMKDRKNHTEKGKIAPLAAMQLDEIERQKKKFEKTGIKAIQEGKVGAVLLAGGMGTRLGSDNPKGMYDIGITRPVFIFQRLIENLLEVTDRAGAKVPLFVMTSDKNDSATRHFFEEQNYFGYDKSYITFFMQEMAPACDYDGHVFMEEKSIISTSPNGNGGWYSSMYKCGIAQKAIESGIEWLNVFSVDNVLQRIADPCFVGAVIEGDYAVGSKVVRKNAPDEKVGVMCLEDERPSIVEYYELTEELMEAKDAKGEPAYNFGVILNYLFSVKQLEIIREKQLPLHVVEKKIAHIDKAGVPVKPQEPNGCKFEQLVLDMIHELPSCLPFEVIRNYEFAPIKNKTGVDSVESARALCKENNISL